MNERVSSRLSPEYALLGFLFQAPSHGYELHHRLRQQFGNIWHASESQTYNILKRLETQGYIQATAVEQEKLPPRQQLQLTSAGKDRFVEWLAQPTKPSVHAIRVEFITRMYFTQQYFPERLEDLIRTQAEVVKAGLTSLQQLHDKLPAEERYNRLSLELRLKLLSAVMLWLDECLEGPVTGEVGEGDAA